MAAGSKILVIKIGSLGVSESQGGYSLEKIKNLIGDLVSLREQGHKVVLVSSGAINSGKKLLPAIYEKTHETKHSIAVQQALSALGQPYLMKAYQDILSPHNIVPAQILVTHEDFRHRERHFNIRNTLLTLLHAGALPIVNENDTVSFKEITVGDNDQLAAMIAQTIDADKLVLLTDADGLYDGHPEDPKSKKLDVVEYDQDLSFIHFSAKTTVGRGGMKTKVEAIRKLTPLGMDVLLGSFKFEKPVTRVLEGLGGTCFKGSPQAKTRHKKAWLATTAKTQCFLVVDDGAKNALLKGASLLPVGIKKILGTFKRGDVVAIKHQRETIAFGSVEYSSQELEKIKGIKSAELSLKLSEVVADEAVHRDNLFLKKQSPV
jgi:glutamate 5-kinase